MLTKYADAELRLEINAEIDALEAQGHVVHPNWVTHTICKRHASGLSGDHGAADDVEPRDVAFWRFNGYTHTRKLATECINERGAASASEAPHTPYLPGYEHVQHYYVVRRDGEDVMVPTDQMTSGELRAKADLYDANAVKLAAHARELRRLADARDAERVASGQ